MITTNIPLSQLEPNRGQVEGLPKNPRILRDERFKALKKSIEDDPEMLELRELLVYPTEGGQYVVIGGNMRLRVLQDLKAETAPCKVIPAETPVEKLKAYATKDNVGFGDWDWEALGANWDAEQLTGWGLELPSEWGMQKRAGLSDENEVPEALEVSCTTSGDVWLLGGHRVMCGDSTVAEHLDILMAGRTAQLIHADPPYGMGKEKDGVANDNLYKEKLDAFQMAWWTAARKHADNNGSAYIWGNAPDLWRLWYVGGLCSTEKLELRNEIVWDKVAIPGMASPDLTQYPEASERCLFIQIGTQFLGNINSYDFPDAWEPLRSSLAEEAARAGVKPPDIKRVCGCQMYGHWFTRSQFTIIPQKHYAKLAEAYPGYFTTPWQTLRAEWDRVKGRGRDVINGKLDGSRSYFDNAHDIMTDVWRFPRVTGEDRHGHATPKPVAMLERVAMSSCPDDGIVLDPFCGTGPMVIACEKLGRTCYTMELLPQWVDVTVRRWQNFTGQKAILEATGQTFDQVRTQRAEAVAQQP